MLRMNEIDQYSGFAKIYDYLLTANYKNNIKNLIRSIQEHYPDMKNAVLADIGGGSGHVTYKICKQVKNVIMIEPSEAMLKIARSKFNQGKHTNIELRKAGFPDCRLEESSIDIIIIVNDPFQYLLSINDQLIALKDLYRSLKEGGLLFIDNMNFFSLIKRYRWPKMMEFSIENKRITIMNQHRVLPIKEQWIHTYNIFITNNETGEINKVVSKHILKMISPTEMRLLLKKTGFAKIEITGSPQPQDRMSTRMWCFAYKS